ncbi:N-acetyltransferase [Paenibacillus sp. LMG 31461]|uniref:N-acetyltransferase n=1 Tax=Paenibacillus plantarum TaxID=2654975 RepID=A0ABX1XJM1_9BACL|nr:N-acetyltransferase [Paenibacillus plantarum]
MHFCVNGGWGSVNTSTTVSVRKASVDDIDKLFEIIQGYAKQGIMLPRSREMLQDQIDTFVVAEFDGLLIGCGSLTRLGPDLVEIRSLGMTPGYKGQGIGGKLVDFLVEEARSQGIIKVMALTYEVAFFQKNGFTLVPKEIFPEKVWRDCMHCKKQYCCDEIAVLKRLD